MRFSHNPAWLLSVALGLLVGCASQHDYKRLPTAEQELYRAYSQIMTAKQSRTYLDRSTATERAAYAKEIGVAQQLEALPPKEREAVLYGQVFRGMSEQALRLVWGKPCRQEGPASNQRWFYHGPAFSLAEVGWHCSAGDTITEVELEHGKVQGWAERIPSIPRRGRR
jgi:hypothetical protein